MKLLRLRLKNLNSIRQEVSLDLERGPLSETSLFAITGPTGAGKTTLLDALSVALYHKTPRLDSTATKNPDNLLSQGREEGFSEVFFEANGKRYLAEWRVKRSKKNTLQSSVKLIDVDTEKLINDKKQDNPVPEILGLDFDSFRRSVLLAQGEFAAFLKAKLDDKRQLLENTTGMGIYDQLRELLNQKLSEVKSGFERLKAALENIPKSNEEEIKATETQLQDAQANLKHLQAERARIVESREIETRRYDNWQQLNQAKKQCDQLHDRKTEVEAFEKEINRAQLAGELLAPKNAFESEQTNLTDSEQARKNAQESLTQSQENLKRYEAELKQHELVFQTAKSSSAEKFELINLASEEEIKATSIETEAQKRTGELADLRNEIQEITTSLKEKHEQEIQIQQEMNRGQQFLAQHPLPADSAKLVAQLNQNIATLREYQNKLTEIEQEGKRKRQNLDQYKATLQQLQNELSQQIKKNEQMIHQKETIEKSFQPLFAEGDESAWEQRRQGAQALQEVALVVETDRQQNSLLIDQQEKLQHESQKIETGISHVESQLAQSRRDFALTEEKLRRLKVEERNVALSKYVTDIRTEQLESGKPCPVCGALEHPWAGKSEPELEVTAKRIKEELLTIEEEFKAQQGDLQKLEQEKSALKATQQQQVSHLKEIQAQIEKYEEEIDKCNARWSPVFPDKPISSQFIKSEITVCESNLKKLRDTQQQIKNFESELLKLNAQISNKQTEAGHLQQQIEKLIEERELLLAQYQQLKQKIGALVSRIRRQLPLEYQQVEPDQGISLLQQRIEQHERTEKKLARLQQELAQIQTFINENEKKVNQTQQRHDRIQTEIIQYQQQVKTLLAQAAEKTGGLSAQAARKKLEQELQELEEKKNHSQNEFQVAKDRVTEAETSWRELSQQHQTIAAKFEKARQAYFEAVKKAGFESIEAHQAALRSVDWLKEKRDMLQEYRQKLYSVEREIQRLDQEFEKAPFNPEHLKSIQTQQAQLEQEIQKFNTQIGTIEEKLNQQKSYLERYKKLEQNLTDAESEYERWHKLNDLIGANKLRDYALKSMFDLLIKFANHQMAKLTSRYILKVKDMKDMVVIDTWNAGEERPVETLSGGESFLTSLALALALSELSKGRAQLGALFLDEGFGSLDTETLEVALDALESLRLAGRRGGIISHVQELTRRIPVRIAVKRMGDGSSTVEVEGSI